MIGFDKAIVSRVVASPRNIGHVRVAADGEDSRQYRISLTAKGRRLQGRMIMMAPGRERRLLSGLAANEAGQLCGLLGRLQAIVQLAHANL